MEFEKLTRIVGRWTVTVEFEYSDLESVAASESLSTIKPLALPDGSYDILALEEYEDFVINLLGVFDRCNFEVLDERKSPESYSYYFDLVKKDQANKKDYKYILFVRISDHEISLDRINYQKDWYSKRAETLKQPQSKSRQKWKVKRILVNKDTYYSYDEALDDIENRLSGI